MARNIQSIAVETQRRLKAAWSRPALARALLAALVVLMGALLHGHLRPTVHLSIEMQSTTGSRGEVFVAAPGGGYSQEWRQAFPIASDGAWHGYTVQLPSSRRIARIRIDPGTAPGEVSVRKVSLREGRTSQELTGRELVAALGIAHDLQRNSAEESRLSFTSEGADPYFDIPLRQPMGGASVLTALRNALVIGATAVLAWWLLEQLASWAVSRAGRMTRTTRFLQRTSSWLSDDQVLRVDSRMVVTFASILVLAIVYVALRLNQSSINLWETVYPYAPVDQAVELGTPKRIRSDEWRVHTPWVMNQVMTGSETRNPNVGGESSPLFTALPVTGAVGWPQAKLLGFRLFAMETGMSWWWAYKSFALMLSFLWLCLLLTRGNLAASLLGAGWIYTSSFTQWWFSSLLPEIMIAFALGMVGAIYALFSAKRSAIVVGCVLVVYAFTNLLLHLYPPFIIPLAYLGLLLLGGYAVQHEFPGWAGHRLKFRAMALTAAAAIAAGYSWLFLGRASGTIAAMLATAYPGQRISASGAVPFTRLVSGFFEPFRLGETHLPLPPTNASEASSYVLLAPLVLLVIPLRSLLRRHSALLVAIGGFLVLAGAWTVIDIPAPLERVLQSLGWSKVTPKRTVMALGIASILACVLLFSRVQDGRLPLRREGTRRMAAAAVACMVLAIGWGLHGIDPVFFTWQILLLGTVASALTATGMALGRTRLLAAGIATFALATITVNPVVSGLAAITEKPVLLAAKAASRGAQDKWLVVGDTTFAQGLKAHGLDVFAGSQFLPDYQSMALLDPTGRYRKVWNRYSTIEIKSDPSLSTARFIGRRPDQFAISLNICGGMPERLGITHVAYTVEVPSGDLRCLSRVPAPPDSGVQLFRITRGRSAPTLPR